MIAMKNTGTILFRFCPLLCLLLALTACGRRQETAPSALPAAPESGIANAELKAVGLAAIQEAFGLLTSNLTAALARGGTTEALPFCKVEALPLTASVGEAYDLELRRVALRVRNPANRASPRAAEIFETMRTAMAQGRALEPVVEMVGDDPVLYAPIILNNPLCLVCHGTPNQQIAPGTMDLLADLYPDDEAVGFQMGDLRGLWEVRAWAR